MLVKNVRRRCDQIQTLCLWLKRQAWTVAGATGASDSDKWHGGTDRRGLIKWLEA